MQSDITAVLSPARVKVHQGPSTIFGKSGPKCLKTIYWAPPRKKRDYIPEKLQVFKVGSVKNWSVLLSKKKIRQILLKGVLIQLCGIILKN